MDGGFRSDQGAISYDGFDCLAPRDRTRSGFSPAIDLIPTVSRVKRRQGRPTQRSDIVGPQVILDAVLRLLSKRHRASILRRDVAVEAQVTSSLVSYYFPNKADLIDQACKPFLMSYIDAVGRIVKSDQSDESRVRELIRTIMLKNHRTGCFLATYIEDIFDRGDEDEVLRLQEMNLNLTEFLADVSRRHGGGVYNGAEIQAIIWALCKTMVKDSRTWSQMDENDTDAIIDDLSRQAFKIVVSGMLGGFLDKSL